MANRYWVGGTAAWNGTAGTKWASTSGGAGGQAVPTSADDVFFDAASTGVCTISFGNTGAKSINCTGFTGTLTGAGTITVSGGVTLVAGMTYSYTGIITLNGTGTITSAGKIFGDISVNGAGITVTLADAFVSNGQLDLAQGTFANPSNFNVTAFNFRSNSGNTCSLSLGSSTWTITGGGAVASWSANNSGLTFNAGTSTINFTYAGVKEFTARNNSTYYNINVGGAGSFGLYVGSALTINSLTNSVQPATVIFSIGSTYTLSNFGLSGTAGNLITIRSDVPGTRFTLSKASGTVNTQYLSIQDSNAIGGATWDALISNGNVDAGNNTGWNFVPRSNMFLMFI